MNLSVNPSPLVDNSSIRVDSQGKISSGLSFSNGLYQNSSHEVSLDLTVSGNTFQGDYQAGNNIQITGNTISCSYEYEAPDESPYVGGNGITVAGKTISNSFSLTADTFKTERTAEDPIQEQTGEGANQVLKSGGGEVVSVSGGLSGIVGPLNGLFGAGGSVIGSASSAISAIGSGMLGGALTGLGAGFITILGRERKREEDVNGNPILDSNGNIQMKPGSNVITVTLPDSNGCDVTRLLFDTPPQCGWLGIATEYPQQAVNLDMLRQYDSQIIQPSTVSLVSQLIDPIIQNLEIVNSVIEGVETDIATNYQPKITSTNKIPYSNISTPPDLSVFLNRNIDLGNINSSIATKQNIISASNRLDYGFLSNIPNLALKQDLITSSAKLPYSLIQITNYHMPTYLAHLI
ncbi:hypothetical protein DFS34DRAFT_625226 [Phlyctochytrium arcticum]|nr:hypothetical protein DFS34DRAFT_637781 [Phlyctochytrium arcticum]KAI9095496.1 hypothetical protein DFS34DRAFT_625999 [Phlyctochytrium arcticum]KAI9095906.1 hypothetical protein DFS34DRAFT_625226 [Phlyctochytrium arcticum]